ncbi:MAG: hypothetical protein IKE91_07335 [Clostridia bacterium]|nr:hypothetical protein [Clostridia bacterium]
MKENYGFTVQYFEIDFVDRNNIRIPAGRRTSDEQKKALKKDLKKMFPEKNFQII